MLDTQIELISSKADAIKNEMSDNLAKNYMTTDNLARKEQQQKDSMKEFKN